MRVAGGSSFTRPRELSRDTSQDYGFMRHALDYFEGKVKGTMLIV